MYKRQYHVCKYTPTELLTALGGQCALLDEAPENFDLSDQVAHPNLCGFGKSVIQAALAGQVKELVLVNCCDTIRSAYDILKEFGNLDFLYLLDILHSQEGCSVQHARDQLLALAEAYGAYKGTQFDRAAFFAAFQSPPPVTGPHIAVLGAKMGSHLFSLVEETMPLPVENATCANNRRVAPPADQGDFAALMEDYARCLLGQLPCMRMTDNTARRALYNTPGLEGVVYHTLQFCDYYGFEYAGLRHQLPVPLLKIESDGTTQSREQLRTRLEAFAEGLDVYKRQDHNRLGGIVQPPVLLQPLAHRLAQGQGAGGGGVFGLVVLNGTDAGLLDVLRGGEIRLSHAEADDVDALGAHFLKLRVDGHGGGCPDRLGKCG